MNYMVDYAEGSEEANLASFFVKEKLLRKEEEYQDLVEIVTAVRARYDRLKTLAINVCVAEERSAEDLELAINLLRKELTR